MWRIARRIVVVVACGAAFACSSLRWGPQSPNFGAGKPFTVVVTRLAGDPHGEKTSKIVRGLVDLDRRLDKKALNVIVVQDALPCWKASAEPTPACHEEALALAREQRADATFWGRTSEKDSGWVRLYWSGAHGGQRVVRPLAGPSSVLRWNDFGVVLGTIAVERASTTGDADSLRKATELARQVELVIEAPDAVPPLGHYEQACLRLLLGSLRLGAGTLQRDSLVLIQAAQELERAERGFRLETSRKQLAEARLARGQALFELAELDKNPSSYERAIGTLSSAAGLFDSLDEPSDWRRAQRLAAAAEHRAGLATKDPRLVRAAQDRLVDLMRHESPSQDPASWAETQTTLCETMTDVAVLERHPEPAREAISRCQAALEVARGRSARVEGRALCALSQAWLAVADLAPDAAARKRAVTVAEQAMARLDPSTDAALHQKAKELADKARAPAPSTRCTVPKKLPSGNALVDDFEGPLAWFAWKSPGGAIFGTAVDGGGAKPNVGEIPGSRFAAHIWSHGVTEYGSAIGYAGWDPCADLRGYTALAFWAKRGTSADPRFRGELIISLLIPALHPGPLCQEGCHDYHKARVELTPDWKRYVVPIADFRQDGWGKRADFTPEEVHGIHFGLAGTPEGLATDLWLDNIELVP